MMESPSDPSVRRALLWITAIIVFSIAGGNAVLNYGRAWYGKRICASNLEADIREGLPELDPSVEKCDRFSSDSLCFVNVLMSGSRKTLPLRWDCRQRRLPDGLTSAMKTANEALFLQKYGKASVENLIDLSARLAAAQ